LKSLSNLDETNRKSSINNRQLAKTGFGGFEVEMMEGNLIQLLRFVHGARFQVAGHWNL
jgi:hypothetical protein